MAIVAADQHLRATPPVNCAVPPQRFYLIIEPDALKCDWLSGEAMGLINEAVFYWRRVHQVHIHTTVLLAAFLRLVISHRVGFTKFFQG